MTTSLWPIVLTGVFTPVGAWAALGGVGWIGPAGCCTRTHEKAKRRDDKFEEWSLRFMSSIIGYRASNRRTTSWFRNPCHLRQGQSISSVYFPQFSE